MTDSSASSLLRIRIFNTVKEFYVEMTLGVSFTTSSNPHIDSSDIIQCWYQVIFEAHATPTDDRDFFVFSVM